MYTEFLGLKLKFAIVNTMVGYIACTERLNSLTTTVELNSCLTSIKSNLFDSVFTISGPVDPFFS